MSSLMTEFNPQDPKERTNSCKLPSDLHVGTMTRAQCTHVHNACMHAHTPNTETNQMRLPTANVCVSSNLAHP